MQSMDLSLPLAPLDLSTGSRPPLHVGEETAEPCLAEYLRYRSAAAAATELFYPIFGSVSNMYGMGRVPSHPVKIAHSWPLRPVSSLTGRSGHGQREWSIPFKQHLSLRSSLFPNEPLALMVPSFNYMSDELTSDCLLITGQP